MRKALALYFVIALLAFSHDLWLERKGNTYTLYYGHIHPEDTSEGLIKYRPEQVLEVKCFNKEGEPLSCTAEKTYPLRITVPSSCAAVYILFTSGYWTKTVEGIKNLPKDRAQNAVSGWISYESVKRIDEWSDQLERPLTDELEIIPLTNPFKTRVGDKITVGVYYKGRPLKDVPVAYDGHTIGTTDRDGRINVRIRHKGLQLISASVKEKADGIKADFVIRTTALSFEVER